MRILELATLLKDKYQNLDSAIKINNLIVGVEQITGNFQQMRSTILYLVDSHFPLLYERENGNILYSGKKSPAEQSVYPGNIIWLGEASDLDQAELRNDIQEILEQHATLNAYTAELHGCLLLEDYLDTLAEKAYQILKNPVAFFNHTHRAMVFKPNEPINHAIWQQHTALGHPDFHPLDDWYHQLIRQLTQTQEPVWVDLEGTPCVICSVFSGDNFIGYVAVIEMNQKISADDVRVLKVVADILMLKNVKSASVYGTNEFYYSQILKDLLTGDVKTHKELDARLRTRNWGVKKYKRVVLISTFRETAKYIGYLKKRITDISSDIKTMVFEEYLLLLLEQREKGETEILLRVKRFIQEYEKVAGFSDEFEDLLQLSKYYSQAEKAIQLGELLNLDLRIHTYMDYRLSDFFKNCCDKIELQDFYHPLVHELMAYDQQNQAELGNTLHQYLKNNRSLTQTSAQLFVHKNTVHYRINKIKDLFGADFDDFKEMYHIYLSYQLMDMAEKLDK